ncbi:hypothetical protein MUK42_36286 [Musa troglodytarum]|uniref:Uncharacterized protein n=1 Tax=Musa troglodytarum TaxID=320322 RepID=A0A9E7JD75_9LILI|nr:hypothetical protein MUK42_36286 [Musa troglodytarum]
MQLSMAVNAHFQMYDLASNLRQHLKAVHQKLQPLACRFSGCGKKILLQVPQEFLVLSIPLLLIGSALGGSIHIHAQALQLPRPCLSTILRPFLLVALPHQKSLGQDKTFMLLDLKVVTVRCIQIVAEGIIPRIQEMTEVGFYGKHCIVLPKIRHTRNLCMGQHVPEATDGNLSGLHLDIENDVFHELSAGEQCLEGRPPELVSVEEGAPESERVDQGNGIGNLGAED